MKCDVVVIVVFVKDLAVSILCLALCRCGVAGPVGARESPVSLTGTTCNALARSLLWNVSAVLAMVSVTTINQHI